ncbi:MAG: hypothetical protein Q8Q21_00680 [bacterium]|nr:hypothetical protein [bacterium]
MTKIINKTIKRKSIKPIIIKAVFGGVLILGALYVCLVSIIVLNATESERNLKNISAQEYQNIELEREYIELIGKLDFKYAQEMGFVSQKAKVVYVSGGHTLSIR